jgi:hypothetical protein
VLHGPWTILRALMHEMKKSIFHIIMKTAVNEHQKCVTHHLVLILASLSAELSPAQYFATAKKTTS